MLETRERVDPDEELREAFKVFDRNGDGFISPEELKTAMTNLGENLTNREYNRLFKQADLNKDGQLDYKGKALSINIFKPNRIIHYYQLDKSITVLKFVGWLFSFLFKF